jgi:hypothetical protein
MTPFRSVDYKANKVLDSLKGIKYHWDMENHFFHGMNDETKPAPKSLADVPTSPEMLAAFAKVEAAKTVIELNEEVPETDDLLEILLGGH